MEDLGCKIERLRNGLYSRSDLAQEIGVSLNTMGRYERGEMSPSEEALAMLASALRISTEELIDNSISLASKAMRVVLHALSQPDARALIKPALINGEIVTRVNVYQGEKLVIVGVNALVWQRLQICRFVQMRDPAIWIISESGKEELSY